MANTPLEIDTESLPGFVVGQFQTVTIEASGGAPPYRFELSEGSAPAGLNFSESGVLSGTPTQTGTSTLWVKVSDTQGASNTSAFDLEIDD